MIKYTKDILKERKSITKPTTLQIGNDDFEKWLHEDSLKIKQNSKRNKNLARGV